MTATHEQARGLLDEGLRYLGQYLDGSTSSALPLSIGRFRAAARLEPGHALNWIALGYALDIADRPRDALSAFQRAARLRPDDDEVEVFIVTLISELGPESDALAAVQTTADRMGVDLEQLGSALTAAGMPTDSRTLLQNGFLHARNFIRSRIEDETDRVERETDPEAWLRYEEQVGRECMEELEGLAARLDPEQIPTAVREIAPWAARLGVGDSACREMLLGRLTEAERSELDGVTERVAPHGHAWLDSFGDSPLPEAAAALMFLFLALEENPVA